ncbi:MAG: hypothetical protein ABWZ27_11685 [Aestuariivirgaceae bacterium]
MTQSSSDFPSSTSSAGKPRHQANPQGGHGGGLDIAGESQKLVGVGRRMASTWLDGRKETLTQTFTSTAQGLRRLGDSYGDQPNIKSYIDAAADGLDTVSEELGNQRIEDLARQAESFSRNYPVTVFAGALAAGLVVSRILRSAAEGGFDSNGGGDTGTGASGQRRTPRPGGRGRGQAAGDNP